MLLNRWSAEQDSGQAVSKVDSIRFRKVSAPGLLFLVITVTFASVDWIMSLEPEWFSTIFGLLTIAGYGLTGLAFTIVVLAAIDRDRPAGSLLTPRHFHDFGKLLLAFTMLWAYLSFSQFLIIWSGNLPEEIPWYIARIRGSWGAVAIAARRRSLLPAVRAAAVRRPQEAQQPAAEGRGVHPGDAAGRSDLVRGAGVPAHGPGGSRRRATA